MNRITTLFNNKNKNILSVFFTAGATKIDDTLEILEVAQNKGIDLVEIGIPFSDPMADGPTIQKSSTAALKNGMSLKTLFSQLEYLRKGNILENGEYSGRNLILPVILMGYLNPIIQYGIENFCRKAHECGIDGVIIPDLPFKEYMTTYKTLSKKYDLKFIMLITPETSQERIRLIDSNTEGFIYMVSTASTTGAKAEFNQQTNEYFERVNAMNLKNPRLIGFGISNKKTLDNAWSNSSGAIIGSKFVTCLNDNSNAQTAVDALLKDLQR